MNGASAIYDTNFRNFIAEISTCLEECMKIKDDLQIEFEKIKLCMEGEQKEIIMSKYSSISVMMKTTINNIKTYISDLENVVNAFSSSDEKIASKVINDIKKINGGDL